MRRFLSAVLGAMLLPAPTGGAAAAAPGSTFNGAWTSIDDADGSTQSLHVSGDAPPPVTLVDLYARYCASRSAPSTVFTGSGAGMMDGDVLKVGASSG